jgi:hypothetical protein
MATISMDGVLAVEVEAQATITTTTGTVILPAYTPRAFTGEITLTGVVVHIMRNATSQAGKPLQVFRIDQVVSTV